MNEDPPASIVQPIGSFGPKPTAQLGQLPKIYLIARITETAHKWNELVCSSLSDIADVFIPHQHNPWNQVHEEFSRSVFNTDLQAMQQADAALILPPYGNDCSFEVGWFYGSGKAVVCFVEQELGWLRDWMVKGGITVTVTSNPKTFDSLICDPFFSDEQIVLIEDLSELSLVLSSVLHLPKLREILCA
jgi:nucleoside 2-deoxyribosyltransferase